MNKAFNLLSLLVLVLTLNGCSTMPESEPKPMIKLKTLESRDSTNHDFTIGLSLAGGGTKASSFSMGVLQGLSETEVINKVDVISTVSGGGYAALWFYTRLLNDSRVTHEPLISNRIAPFFKECLSTTYDDLVEADPSVLCKNDITFFSSEDPSDPYRFQNYLRGYQDIFSSGTDLFGNPAFNMSVTDQKGDRLSNDIGQLGIKTLLAAGINFIPNIVFDWEWNVSPTRSAYKRGILRTYGADVAPCQTEKACKKYRPEGNTDWVEQLTFDNLRLAYESKDENERLPLWIINTTAGENRQLFNFGESSPFTLTSYEMTPYGAGSGRYDYYYYDDEEFNENLPNDIMVSDAVVMSAAFFDEQQRALDSRLNGILKPVQSLSTVNWGVSHKNPRVSQTKQLVHKLLPWPLYYFHGFNGPESVNIRYSDGGQSENLGAYALIRRQVTDIIISDHSQDRDGRMADICNLKNNLASDKLPLQLYLHIPGLEGFNEVCDDKKSKGYGVFDWKHPILLGCVSKSNNVGSCTGDNDLISRLYIIKPVLPARVNAYTKLGEFLPFPRKKQNLNCFHLQANSNYEGSVDFIDWKFEDKVSCELTGFWKHAEMVEEKGFNKDGKPHFPQYPTVNLTVKSSNTIYGALRELSRYYARQLAWFFGPDSSSDEVKKKFKKIIELQQSNAMKRID